MIKRSGSGTIEDFQLFLVGEEIQGVQYAGDGEIGDLLSNPRNVCPPEGYSPMKGIARALVTAAPDGGRTTTGMTLIPANDCVRALYEHLGFEEIPGQESLVLSWEKLDALRAGAAGGAGH